MATLPSQRENETGTPWLFSAWLGELGRFSSSVIKPMSWWKDQKKKEIVTMCKYKVKRYDCSTDLCFQDHGMYQTQLQDLI